MSEINMHFMDDPLVNEFPNGKLILTLWEARWHGFAKWSLEVRVPVEAGAWIKEVAHGWWRPPTGWKCASIEVKDYKGNPMKWINNFGRGGRLMSFKVEA